MNPFEVLAPLGQLEALPSIMAAGADAVYAGLYGLSSRPSGADLTLDELRQARELTAQNGVRLLVAVNTFVGHADMKNLLRQIESLEEMGADAVILADWGVLWAARELLRHTQLHASTLLGVHNAEAVRVLRTMGVSRVVLSTTLYVHEMYDIIQSAPDMEYEIIASGGVCGNDNRQCELPHSDDASHYQVACRRAYQLRGEGIDRAAKPISLPEAQLERVLGLYMAMGIHSYKIEGRTVPAQVICRRIARLRRAVDSFMADQESFQYYNPYLNRAAGVKG